MEFIQLHTPDPFSSKYDNIVKKLKAAKDNCADLTKLVVELNKAIDNTDEFHRIGQQLQKDKILTQSDWRTVLFQLKIIDKLGRIPANCSDFLECYLKQYPVTVNAKGDIRASEIPVLFGHPVYDASDNVEQLGAIVQYTVNKFREGFQLNDLERKLNIINTDLHLGYKQYEISNVVVEWYKLRKLEQWAHFTAGILYDPSIAAKVRREGLWAKLARAAFSFPSDDVSEDSNAQQGMARIEIVIAVLQKFIWQVKRKVIGKEVTDHLMLILFGPQGRGKSGFTKLFTAILELYRAETNFSAIIDDRNIDLFTENYVLVLDEMSNAAKADMEVVKRVITAETETKREMRSNGATKFKNNTTMIGSTNKRISQLIKDETGLRRFFELFFKQDGADWDVLNNIDMAAMWQSVNELGPDPTLPFMSEIKAIQLTNLSKSTVEEWSETLETNVWNKGVNKENSYMFYKDWCIKFYPKRVLDFSAWHEECQRLINYPDSSFKLRWVRAKSGMKYKI